MSRDQKKEIHIYTDGGSRGNPGPGAWGNLRINLITREIHECGFYFESTTNNHMELLAVKEALLFLQNTSFDFAYLYSDSSYVLQGLEKWIFGWRKNNWKTKEGKPVRHAKLWEETGMIYDTIRQKTKLSHVPGHAGVAGNEIVDGVVNQTMDTQSEYYAHYTTEEYSTSLDELLHPSLEQDKSYPKYLCFYLGEFSSFSEWNECKSYVEGKSGIRYKKISSAHEEKTWKESLKKS